MSRREEKSPVTSMMKFFLQEHIWGIFRTGFVCKQSCSALCFSTAADFLMFGSTNSLPLHLVFFVVVIFFLFFLHTGSRCVKLLLLLTALYRFITVWSSGVFFNYTGWLKGESGVQGGTIPFLAELKDDGAKKLVLHQKMSLFHRCRESLSLFNGMHACFFSASTYAIGRCDFTVQNKASHILRGSEWSGG